MCAGNPTDNIPVSCTQPSLLVGSCLPGLCSTPIALSKSTTAVAEMMMGSAPGCVPPGHPFRLQKDNNSEGAIKLLLIIAKDSSDVQMEKHFTIMPIVTKLSLEFSSTKLRSFAWHCDHLGQG